MTRVAPNAAGPPRAPPPPLHPCSGRGFTLQGSGDCPRKSAARLPTEELAACTLTDPPAHAHWAHPLQAHPSCARASCSGAWPWWWASPGGSGRSGRMRGSAAATSWPGWWGPWMMPAAAAAAAARLKVKRRSGGGEERAQAVLVGAVAERGGATAGVSAGRARVVAKQSNNGPAATIKQPNFERTPRSSTKSVSL